MFYGNIGSFFPTSFLLTPGLQVGDQIMEVNGHSFRSVAHDEAVQILKSSRHMLMTIKDVGRLPHARTVVDETKWISSPLIAESSTGAALRSVWCASMYLLLLLLFVLLIGRIHAVLCVLSLILYTCMLFMFSPPRSSFPGSAGERIDELQLGCIPGVYVYDYVYFPCALYYWA